MGDVRTVISGPRARLWPSVRQVRLAAATLWLLAACTPLPKAEEDERPATGDRRDGGRDAAALDGGSESDTALDSGGRSRDADSDRDANVRRDSGPDQGASARRDSGPAPDAGGDDRPPEPPPQRCDAAGAPRCASGVCGPSGTCVACLADADCMPAAECEQASCRTTDNSCQRRPKAAGVACADGNVCDGAGECAECTTDLHCGSNASCVENACRCEPGFAPNPTARGCNFDECAKFDDNRCGAADGTANRCLNTVDNYDCTCGLGWQSGADQCFQSGTGTSSRTVSNGASWNVLPLFEIKCANAFDTNVPCSAPGQLVWLNTCGLPEVTPTSCSVIRGSQSSLLTVNLKRVEYTGALESYGVPTSSGFSDHIDDPKPSDVILVQTLTALYIMRILALDGAAMTYEWAAVWRDTCWRPGGVTCTAACGCPDGN